MLKFLFTQPTPTQGLWHYLPGHMFWLAQKLFLAQRAKSRSQGHWSWCHLKGHHWLSMNAKYKVSISYTSKVIANVKVDNRKTDRQNKRPKGPHIVHLSTIRDVENFFSMSDIRSDKLKKFVRPNENMPDRIYILHNSTPFFRNITKYLAWCSIT